MGKRLFEQGADTPPLSTHKVAWGLAGNTTKNSLWSTVVSWLETQLNLSISNISNLETEETLVNIGDWNMDANSSVTVAHGLSDITKIRGIDVMIRNDTDSQILPLNAFASVGSGQSQGGVSLIDSTNVTLVRFNAGTFDNTNFDSTSYNRGFILIRTIP